ncbi:aquaporin Z [Microbacterium sp. cx-55]|uniref:aquaporin Z n=1 Tax=Microbacterium sp. cx-55 TaxID=2875948 RepID=UPI001CBF6FFD|nr:aquaporin Z [Microbacterium sp. cx-55]MBZ4487240.1 aquaporin Z [Microbacterium sp. cx-55]UGB35264.1 aquaporin Z [Microbacterium sp. cx-55]
MSTDPHPEPKIAATALDHTPPAAGPTRTATWLAELLGTYVLVLGGVGAALFAADFGSSANGTSLGIGFVGVSLAFGLTVVAGAYAWGPISGGHFNPAVTLGLAAAGRISWATTPGYIASQLVGGVLATSTIVAIGAAGNAPWLSAATEGGFASNGYGELSPGGFGIGAAIIAEIVLTAVFVLIILGVTHRTRGTGFAGLVIGLTLTLIHLISIPIDNTSVNPARSIAAAIFGGSEPFGQLWVFIMFPIVGGLAAGLLHRLLFDGRD